MMRTLTRMLQAVIQSKPTHRTARKMIVLKDRKSYLTCVRQLHRQGIVPFKQIASARMFCCHFDRHKDLQRLMKHPNIQHIETDAPVQAHFTNTTKQTQRKSRASCPPRLKKRYPSISAITTQIPWGVERIHAPQVWSYTKGNNIKVAIIDTGISTHPDLTIAGGTNTIQRGASYQDDNGHGTHVAGTVAAKGTANMIYGVAPEVKLYAVKALDENGDGYVSDIVEGLEWCMQNKMGVVNLSFGLSSPSELLRSTVQRAYGKGIVLVASAGNSGSDAITIDEPARYPETIAVAATDQANQMAIFSSRGKEVDVAAPGEDILSTNNKKGYSLDSGTSMSAPHVSGTVALLLASNPKLTPQAIKKALVNTAVALKGPEDRQQHAGLIRADQATAYVETSKMMVSTHSARKRLGHQACHTATRNAPTYKPKKSEPQVARQRWMKTSISKSPASKLRNVMKPRRR